MPALERAIDNYIGNILCTLIGIFRTKKQLSKDIRSILIIKLWAIGESVLTLPFIHALKQKYPTTKITVIARNRNKAVYEGLPFIDTVLLFEPAQLFSFLKLFKQFDLAIDGEPYLNLSALLGRLLAHTQIGFDHGKRALLYDTTVHYNDQQHVVKTYLDLGKPLGISATYDHLIELSTTEEDDATAEGLLHQKGITKKDFVVGICPTVAETAKDRMWPQEYYAKVINTLVTENNAKVLLVGALGDYNHNEALRTLCLKKEFIFNIAGTSLKQLFAIVKRCNLFISNDTGPMHIAAAQGTKTIGIFGPNLPTRFAPYGNKNKTVYIKQYCSPCINVHQGYFPACYNQIKGKCLKDITPAAVMEVVQACLVA